MNKTIDFINRIIVDIQPERENVEAIEYFVNEDAIEDVNYIRVQLLKVLKRETNLYYISIVNSIICLLAVGFSIASIFNYLDNEAVVELATISVAMALSHVVKIQDRSLKELREISNRYKSMIKKLES